MAESPRSPRIGNVLLVAVGGALGTTVRYALTSALPDGGSFPTAVAAINIAGAFCLGWLTSWRVARAAPSPRRAAVALLGGTGFLGGFTTYGTFIGDEDALLGMAEMSGTWIVFGVPVVIAGVLAAWGGASVGRRIHGAPARPAAA